MDRRQFITAVASGGIATVAGCMGADTFESVSGEEDAATAASYEWNDGWPPGTSDTPHIDPETFLTFHDTVLQDTGYASTVTTYERAKSLSALDDPTYRENHSHEYKTLELETYADFEAGRFSSYQDGRVRYYGTTETVTGVGPDGRQESREEWSNAMRRYLCPRYPHLFVSYKPIEAQRDVRDGWAYHFRSHGQGNNRLSADLVSDWVMQREGRGAVLALDAEGRAVYFSARLAKWGSDIEWPMTQITSKVRSFGDSGIADKISAP